MTDHRYSENSFLQKIKSIVEENISNEQFGVSDLANEIGMSRSNLLRKVKKLTNLSVSQYIRNIRLQHAKEMLKDESLTVSEVSYKVGFGSPSYFIKCFGDYYGYPPGEIAKTDNYENEAEQSSTQTHKLAAIMFTDIEGYTALMQHNEKKAVELRNRHREVFKSVTEKFNGQILQYFGDGTLSTFNSAIDAVRCGIEMQLKFQQEPLIPVRIGIHSGDIIFNEEGIIGDGVNVASRIESLAVSGSVFISEKVYDEVKNQSRIKTVSLGVFNLKNVEKPLEVYAISNPGLLVPNREDITRKEKRTEKDVTSKKQMWISWKLLKWIAAVVIIISAIYLITSSDFYINATQDARAGGRKNAKKSIAVLPFKNDSNDSTNVYIINGLMESTLNNLQLIEDLRVISRTSVEKYRNNPKTTPEIAKELNANYLIEGSGQKIGDQILLTIQLIEAATDDHLWSRQYERNAEDIFKLQAEVAKNIAEQVEAIITPEEEERIEKAPTNNLVAYDLFLQGLDLLNNPVSNNVVKSLPYFHKAIAHDNKFARAYAATAIAYYVVDEPKLEKQFSDSINYYADQALLHDSQLPQSLVAKALFYMAHNEFELAVPYFEKALELSPNNDVVLIFLVDLYVHHLPNTEKYIEYALKGLEIDLVAAYDSATASLSYLHISNAFIQSGFVDEAEKYINKSLELMPDNLYSQYVRAFILFTKNKDLYRLNGSLLAVFEKDSTRLDVLQEVAKSFYYLRDYESSYSYYKPFVEIREAYKLDMYRSENCKIGFVYNKVGDSEKGKELLEDFKYLAENTKSIYQHYNLALYHSYKGEKEKALEHLRLFSEESNYHYWILVFTELEPLMDNIKDLPEFKKVFSKIEDKFDKYHKRIEVSLTEKGLL